MLALFEFLELHEFEKSTVCCAEPLCLYLYLYLYLYLFAYLVGWSLWILLSHWYIFGPTNARWHTFIESKERIWDEIFVFDLPGLNMNVCYQCDTHLIHIRPAPISWQASFDTPRPGSCSRPLSPSTHQYDTNTQMKYTQIHRHINPWSDSRIGDN